MGKRKFCSECGHEIKTEFRTRDEILDNINRLLKIDIKGIKGKQDLIDLEDAIKQIRHRLEWCRYENNKRINRNGRI